MEIGLQSFKKPVELNPELEALRTKGLQENTLQSDEWILHMINRTSRIHAGFLFEYRKTLQSICLYISETQNKITDAGWEAFGYHLGLSPIILKVINHNNFNKEDPCYNILLAYVQFENASIGKVLEALYVIKRIDVLCRIQDSINELTDTINNLLYNSNCSSSSSSSNNIVEETSDYESMSASEGCRHSGSNLNSLNDTFIRPKFIPPAPFIFQNFQSDKEHFMHKVPIALNEIKLFNAFSANNKANINDAENVINNKLTCVPNMNENFETSVIRESIQNSDFSKKENPRIVKPQKYSLKIFLTFAEDGEKYIKEICQVFRKKRENFQNIGVLVLSEHVELVNKDPHQFIFEAFHQVDYVCPVLTSGYFNLITRKLKFPSQSNIHIDAAYAPYVYNLMNSYFTSNNCLNDKVRSIIPECEFPLISCNVWLSNPIYGAWVKLGEVDDLAVRLLKSNRYKL